MTERRKAICEVAGVKEIGDVSDGSHTFKQLYYQRMMLFAALVKQNRDKAWKSLRHEDGELCFGGGWFVVGIDTPEGSYTYHYEDKYFGIFDCIELECGKHWDGHTEEDVTRLLSLERESSETIHGSTYGGVSWGGTYKPQQPCDDAISRQAVVDYLCTHCPDDAECFEDCDDIKNIKTLALVTPIGASEDCISRQAVLEKAINVPLAKVVTEDKFIYRKVIFADDIEKLPSVTPRPKMVEEK